MSGADPMARALDLLRSAGYQELETPLVVATIPFDIGIPMISKRSLNVLLVVDTLSRHDPEGIRRQTDGLSRALDTIESRRSLTVIFVGPAPGVRIVDAISRVARVLAVGTPVGDRAEQDLADSLLVLLPLSVPHHEDERAQPWHEIRQAMAAQYAEPEFEPIFEATYKDAVEEALERVLAEPLKGLGLA
jgi:hypothetical protein